MPIVYSLDIEWCGKYCQGCLLPIQNEKLKCSGCSKFYYCSENCRKSDWDRFHGLGECDIYAKEKPEFELDNFRVRMSLRFYLQLKHRPEEMAQCFNVLGRKKSFNDLPKVEFPENYSNGVGGVWKSAFRAMGLEFDLDEMQPFIAKCFIYSTVIYDKLKRKIGSALYIEPSLLDHSCCPNSFVRLEGLKVKLVAKSKIGERDAVTLSFCSPSKPAWHRKALLKVQFGATFECSCLRCSCQGFDEMILEQFDGPTRQRRAERAVRAMFEQWALEIMIEEFIMTTLFLAQLELE